MYGGGVATRDKSTYLNALATVKSAAETCGVCSIKVRMAAKTSARAFYEATFYGGQFDSAFRNRTPVRKSKIPTRHHEKIIGLEIGRFPDTGTFPLRTSLIYL